MLTEWDPDGTSCGGEGVADCSSPWCDCGDCPGIGLLDRLGEGSVDVGREGEGSKIHLYTLTKVYTYPCLCLSISIHELHQHSLSPPFLV